METNEKLNQLHELQSTKEITEQHFEEVKLTLLTPEIQQALKDIDAEKSTALETLQRNIDDLMAEIKRDILANGATIKGEFLMAVYNKGRVSWNNKGLEGFMVAHPEMAAFRSEGDPSVTIRKI